MSHDASKSSATAYLLFIFHLLCIILLDIILKLTMLFTVL